jgi:hypothetical protein
MEKTLKWRMYGFVNYQLIGIQKGIQFTHVCVEYGQLVKGFTVEDVYNSWANEDKTVILLNGGTTNDSKDNYGTLQKHRDLLVENKILLAEFREPDLNDALTAICFLVSEEVWDKEIYPDFVRTPYPWPYNKKPSLKQKADWEAEDSKNYEAWCDKIGKQNVFLREFLRDKRLA